jgi:beta-phosphoglucomutase
MKAYLFDMDGVIVDNTPYHVKSWQVYARKFGRELGVDEIKRRLGYTNEGYMKYILGRDPTPAEVADAIRQKEAIYRDLFRPHLALPPGFADLLDAADKAGIVCAVATSAPPENVAFVLDGLGIRSRFRCVVDDSQFKRGKPAPDCYLMAAQRLGVPPAECTVFEDAIAGIQAGKAAGMKVIAIASSYPAEILAPYHPDRIIGSFTELAQ